MLYCGQYALERQGFRRTDANTKLLCGLAQTDHLPVGLFWIILRQSEAFAHFPNPHRSPAFVIAGFAPHTVERDRKLLVRPVAGKLTERFNRRRREVFGIASGFHACDADFGMTPAVPMYEQHHFVVVSSRSKMISLIRTWISRCLVRVSVDGAFHTAGKSWESRRSASRSILGRAAADNRNSSILASSSATCCNALFHRVSSSRATWRFAGSTISWRRAASDAS